MREGRRSQTSDWVAALRALYTEGPAELAVVDDPAALELVPRPLSTLVRVGARIPFGLRALHRALGAASFGLTYGVPLRTAAIDEAVRRSVREGIDQLVVLGAGLDARAWRMPELSNVVVYELDHPSTQAYKRERIAELPPLAREVRHAPIDFEHQAIPDVLAQAGFDRARRSIWVWEGVTMYLTERAVEATLDAVAASSACGSRLALTYIPPNYGKAWQRVVGSIGGRVIGESLRAHIAADHLARALGTRGFELESDDDAPEWARRFWRERDASRVRSFERLAIARRVRAPAQTSIDAVQSCVQGECFGQFFVVCRGCGSSAAEVSVRRAASIRGGRRWCVALLCS